MSHASALKALCPDSGSAQKNVMPFYIKLILTHFNDIFDYHSHISENNITTVRWFLLTVSFIVPHLGLIFLHSCRLTGVALDLG